MAILDPGQIVAIVTIVVSGVLMGVGMIAPTVMEGKVAVKAMEGIARQPDAAGPIRLSMIIGMALCETSNIYVLLVVLILLFANPLVTKFFGG